MSLRSVLPQGYRATASIATLRPTIRIESMQKREPIADIHQIIKFDSQKELVEDWDKIQKQVPEFVMSELPSYHLLPRIGEGFVADVGPPIRVSRRHDGSLVSVLLLSFDLIWLRPTKRIPEAVADVPTF